MSNDVAFGFPALDARRKVSAPAPRLERWAVLSAWRFTMTAWLLGSLALGAAPALAASKAAPRHPARLASSVHVASTHMAKASAHKAGTAKTSKAHRAPAKHPLPAPAPGQPQATSAVSNDSLIETVGTIAELGSDRSFTDTIDWSRRVVTVMGVGIAPDRGTLAVRSKVAQAYAFDDAMRQLSSVVDGVRVNGDATVGDLTVSDDAVRSAVDTRIAEAQVVDTNILPDGSVELTLQLALFGKDGLAGAVLNDEPSPIVFASDATASLPTSPYTGIILDARNAGAQPALAPTIHSIDGQGLADRPSVAYVHTMEAARDLAGDAPLTFNVARAAGNTRADLLLSDSDLQKFKSAWSKGGLSLVIVL